MEHDLITIRPFGKGDIGSAVALEAASQPRPWTEGIFADELVAQDRVYLAAEAGGFVGFGGVMVIGEEAHVTNLLVSVERRGQGIGRRLLIELMRSAVAAGASHLTLEVRARNQAARSLYSSVGLAPVGIRPGYYDDDDALIMWAHDIDRPGYMESLE